MIEMQQEAPAAPLTGRFEAAQSNKKRKLRFGYLLPGLDSVFSTDSYQLTSMILVCKGPNDEMVCPPLSPDQCGQWHQKERHFLLLSTLLANSHVSRRVLLDTTLIIRSLILHAPY